jgi:Ca2+-binding EF-hand superfamily protein
MGKMMSSVNSIGGGGYPMAPPMKRQDSTQLAETLFAKLDTSGQGYIQKSDLQSAFDKIATTSSTGGSTPEVDDLFSKFDGNDDGKVTKQEFSDTVRKLSAQLDDHFASTRMQNAIPGGEISGMNGSGGMPPPPPPPGEGPSLSKDDLSSTLNRVGTSDSRSNMMSNILNIFDQADTDGDGKVSFEEAMAYDQANRTSEASTQSLLSGTDFSAGSASNDLNFQLIQQIMKLAEAYGVASEAGSAVGTSFLTTA